MTTYTGTGTGTPATPTATTAPCTEYVTVADLRAEFGDDVAELTDAQIQRKIDSLVALLEENLGHSFGRALLVSSTDADAVIVTSTMLVIGGDAFTFEDYPSLAELAAAANAAGGSYSVEVLPQVNTATPSDLLAQRSSVACGPDYDDRVILCLSAMYVSCHGEGQTHLFLPLPVASMVEVTENGTEIESTGYWVKAGEPWLIKKLCGCSSSTSCYHPRGRWSNAYPANVLVTYVPQWWNKPPATLKRALIEAFETQAGIGGALQSESFGGAYSYSRRADARRGTWQDALGGASVRQFAIRYMPMS